MSVIILYTVFTKLSIQIFAFTNICDIHIVSTFKNVCFYKLLSKRKWVCMMSKIPKLFEYMKQNKITSKALAEGIGVSQGNVSDWKSGRSAPTSDVLAKIADFLGVSVDYLLTGIDTKKEPSQPDDRWKRYEKQINELPASSQERLMKQFQAMIDIEKESHRNQ